VRKWNWKRIGWIAGILFVVWMAVGIIRAGRNAPQIPGAQNILIKDCSIRGNRISTRSWSFGCKKAQLSPDGILATIDGVHDGILYKKGKPYLRIAAQHVSLNTQTFDFTATGDVHVEALHPSDGIAKSFDTDLVQWVNATKLLQLPHASLFRTNGQALKVATITVDFNKNDIRLGKITGSVEAP
jgi:hypothetical protein